MAPSLFVVRLGTCLAMPLGIERTSFKNMQRVVNISVCKKQQRFVNIAQYSTICAICEEYIEPTNQYTMICHKRPPPGKQVEFLEKLRVKPI